MYLLPYLPPIFQNDAVTPSMKVSEAWADGYTGKGVIIAILDDGLQTIKYILVPIYICI
jgi:hypothetical protein